jgi:hypothetical protein
MKERSGCIDLSPQRILVSSRGSKSMSKHSLRLVLFSDLHLTNDNKHYRKDPDGRSHLLKAQEDFLSLIQEELESQLHVYGVFLGDLTDKDLIDPYVLRVLTYFNGFLDSDRNSWTLHALEGNHGIRDSQNEYSIIGAMTGYGGHCKPKIAVDAKGLGGTEIRKYFQPYYAIQDMQKDLEALDTGSDGVRLLFVHAPIKNALMDNGLPAPRGLDITEEIAAKFDAIFAGDFHRPQEFMVGNTKVTYVGAPFALTRGQTFNKRYLIVDITVDGQDKEIVVTEKENPYAYNIIDVPYEDLDTIKDSSLERTILYIHDIPSPEAREDLQSKEWIKNCYSVHYRMKPAFKEDKPNRQVDFVNKTDEDIIMDVAKEMANDTSSLSMIQKIVNLVVKK